MDIMVPIEEYRTQWLQIPGYDLFIMTISREELVLSALKLTIVDVYIYLPFKSLHVWNIQYSIVQYITREGHN